MTPTKAAVVVVLSVFCLVLMLLNINISQTVKDDRLCHSLRFGCDRSFNNSRAPREEEIEEVDPPNPVDKDEKRADIDEVHSTDSEEKNGEDVEDLFGIEDEAYDEFAWNKTDKELAIQLEAAAGREIRNIGFGPKKDAKKKAKKKAKVKKPAKAISTKRVNNCAVILSGEGLVRTCVTKDKIGSISADISSMLAEFHSPKFHLVKETPEARADSFKKVFDTLAWGHDWDPNQKGLNVSGNIAFI